MKKIIFTSITLLILFFHASGQILKSENDLKDYYQNNINSLDPLEGIWSLDKLSWIIYYKENLILTDDNPSIIGQKYAIIKSNNKLIVYFCDNKKNSFKLTKEYYTKRAKRGNYYNHMIFLDLEQTTPAIMEDLFSLTFHSKIDRSTNKKNQMIVAMANSIKERNLNQFRMEMDNRYSKIFPTYEFYSNPKNIKSTTSTGTGFAISEDGYIVTNYHVIENSKSIKIKGVQGNFNKSYTAQVSISDKNNDLAILKINDISFHPTGSIPYKLKNKTSDVGDPIFVLGYPLTATMGDEIKLTNGIISSKSGFKGDITTYQITAPVQPGNSGAPLFDEDGNVIGIISSKHTKAENAGYAIKINYLKNLIDALPTKPNLSSNNLLKEKKLSGKVQSVKNYIYIIEVK